VRPCTKRSNSCPFSQATAELHCGPASRTTCLRL
jgi:hypothetical protein